MPFLFYPTQPNELSTIRKIKSKKDINLGRHKKSVALLANPTVIVFIAGAWVDIC
jgi:hypothetical protein